MKSSVLLFLLVLLTSVVIAAGKPTDTYVIIGDKTYYCDDVHVGKASTSMYIHGRRLLKVATYVVDAYAESGRFYEYLPVMRQNQDTAGWAFMQLIASNNGFRVYRYCSSFLKYDPVSGIIAPTLPVYRYYIFKRGKFVSVTDDQNVKAQLAPYGVK